ncbi:hypothetical protein LTR05_008479 [Lithohypha guttulata]|uniref:T6SS Phospholipase effector Tle1-like catalytic domain-containing protein n=1 Tax=Lithohypha guttulata TaxID=1690604 RepID=A0AAN7ST89_9EURO|nr:hypothetical protein LTR05_008479 [Lithohypha guttulata]
MSDRSTSPPIQAPRRKAFILCFDGTGNKFSGTESDSNILKLYRMLDRSSSDVYTFYQPGIGTYITSHSMQTTSLVGRVGSWYSKIKDSAVGSSFAEHVMGGYRFLMRYYSCEDDLYFFGFSRGAYTARFLAEMLDHIGLLSAGNEELVRFAWKTYAKWASRRAQEKEEEAELYEFVRGFRETFSRPVRRIRFLGLFDTVNSVPKFESAWMHRSNFPYTARSSAKVIRHAVSIDERRAKFRQDLISGDQAQHEDRIHPSMHRYNSDLANMNLDYNTAEIHGNWRERLPSHVEVPGYDYNMKDETDRPIDMDDKSSIHLLHIPSATHRKSDSLAARIDRDMAQQQEKSEPIKQIKARRRQYSDETQQSQDIEEVWFPGAHADIGGGWTRSNQETWMLSHVPLVWMVQEAAKAGLEFDPM